MFGDQMLAAPVTRRRTRRPAWLRKRSGCRKASGWNGPRASTSPGPATVDRSFSIDQMPVYLQAGAIVPMQPPMRYTGEKPVDPLIVNVWPLAPGATSSYSVYEDSGVSVEYQQGVFARTPIKATQTGDTLRVEIGPVKGSYPGMLKTRGLRAAPARRLAAGLGYGERSRGEAGGRDRQRRMVV